ncbi:ABC transporter related protein [Desulfovibrio sp. X2]|uniref:ABC transporter ATP-binding protein n=1 Tax=Desulfovibrio sp. X2 TaxID=941449 RepID=UPI0003588F69|nr:ATP-binding cassette domain-containing protein [Desulfovibrio sp. X2]EPR41765.1 ABC transporter related protein [Desulfovibrio sp. X2]
MTLDVNIEALVKGGGREFRLAAEFSSSASSMVLFGPSGSGKTLTLMVLAGLLAPVRGHIKVCGRTLYDSASGVDLPAREREMGLLFQDYALFPHLTVRDNVAFGLRRRLFGFSRLTREQSERVDELLDACGIASLAGHRPHQISGGQRQRAALARALATEPRMLLLDEPFAALDQPLRARMREELCRTRERVGIPMVMVSHDPQDVDVFADCLVAFGHGKVMETLDYTARLAAGATSQSILGPLFETAN